MLTSAATMGSCHPYPGAAATDVLQLIGNKLHSETEHHIAAGEKAVISLGTAAIVTTATQGAITVTDDEMVRRVLTVLGACALSDRGSVSGWYLVDDGAKTCYLYSGKEGMCS